MKPIPGPRPAEVGELTRAQDRLTFVYLERCKIHRSDNAITATDERGVIHFPSAVVGALMLGPGTDITHQAMVVLADSGATVVWVGEHGVRYYAHGRPLARSSRLLIAQAELVSNQQKRLSVARKMYEMRFPDEVVDKMTMQQLRGREGARVRRIYREQAERTGVDWSGRSYNPEDFELSNDINQAITAATSCLYGLVHSVTVALGCSPGLGFVHTGHDRSFVYDIADLYKMELAVPPAFTVVQNDPLDVAAETRLAMRDAFRESKLLKRVVRDVQTLLGSEADEDQLEWSVVELWDGGDRTVAAGRSWGSDPEGLEPPW
ncbi:MAG: type I-E CRISPR-associated endonuclease Cas1e [Propionibacteriales bacterium]|nr:type I-E CRISPR-associated endonuclease Cas1e [Propionibacteriales bacterium]